MTLSTGKQRHHMIKSIKKIKKSRCMRQPTIWVSDQIQQKPACTVTEAGQKLEISDLGRRGIIYYPCYENKGANQLHS